jgi:predicted transcriptional regulator
MPVVDDDAGRRRARGELEAEVMATLWASTEPLTAAEVQAALRDGLAYNTVQTILIRLLDKGLLRRRAAGRAHAYWPAQDAASYTAERMRATLEARPDRQAVLQQFAARLDEADADALRALLDGRPPSPDADPGRG